MLSSFAPKDVPIFDALVKLGMSYCPGPVNNILLLGFYVKFEDVCPYVRSLDIIKYIILK